MNFDPLMIIPPQCRTRFMSDTYIYGTLMRSSTKKKQKYYNDISVIQYYDNVPLISTDL